MISKKLHAAINDQIKKEFYSSYLYLAMAAHCETLNLPGFAKWFIAQSQEEWSHGMKFFGFLNDRGAAVQLQAIEKPEGGYKTPVDVFEKVVEHEAKVSASINGLYELAIAEKDYPAQVLLQWFITEQVEEEKTSGLILEQLKMIPERGGAMLFMDKQLGKRGAAAE